MKYLFLLILAGSSFFANSQTAPVHLLNTFHIASPGGWDYLAVQPNSNKLFVSHSTQVNIIDKNSGDSLGVILNTTGVHGIAFIPALNKGYITSGRLNTVTVFDLKSDNVLLQIPVGINPDAILYDDYAKVIITCNGKSRDLSILDPITEKVTGTIALDGRPETALSDHAGKIFVNIEDKNEIAVVDIKNFKVLNRWKLAPGEAPTGLAYDAKTKRLFSGCGDNKMLMILNAENGHIVDKINIGEGCDGVVFDANEQRIYTSNGEGSLSVIKEVNADKFLLEKTIPTKRSARTIAIDETTHKLYLPAADLQIPANPDERPKMIPGTFQVLVFGN